MSPLAIYSHQIGPQRTRKAPWVTLEPFGLLESPQLLSSAQYEALRGVNTEPAWSWTDFWLQV